MSLDGGTCMSIAQFIVVYLRPVYTVKIFCVISVTSVIIKCHYLYFSVLVLNIIGYGLLEECDVIQNGGQEGRHHQIYWKNAEIARGVEMISLNILLLLVCFFL